MLKNIDNIVIVALHLWKSRFGSQAELAEMLGISPAGLSRSLARLDFARLITRRDLSVINLHAVEYLVHGFRWFFPARIGTRVRGLPTAHSAPPLNERISSQEVIVWPAEFGTVTGLELKPVYHSIPALCVAHPEFYPVFSVLDSLRTGRARERELAARYIQEIFHGH